MTFTSLDPGKGSAPVDRSVAGPSKTVGAASLDFGRSGWTMIIVSMAAYFAYAGWTVDGVNIFIPAFSAQHGWDAGKLLTLVAPASLAGVVGSALFGQIIMRFGPRLVMTACLAGMAAGVFWFGHVHTIQAFTLAFMAMNFLGAGFGFIGPGTLVAHWFPKRKGMALAVATCGFPLATALFVPLIAVMFAKFGIAGASSIWLVVFLVGAAVVGLTVRDTPEALGAFPDNDATAISHPGDETVVGRSAYTVGRLLRDPTMWVISLGWGSLWMVTVGIVAQLVPRLMERGYAQPQAILLLSVAAVCALPGSLMWGYFDQKLGTKRTSLIYGMLYIATLLLLILAPNLPVVVFITVALVGLGLGGIKSLITSIVCSVYGRQDFSAVYRVVIPVSLVIRTLCFPIMGVAISRFHNLTSAYVVFIAIDVIALALVSLTPSKPRPIPSA